MSWRRLAPGLLLVAAAVGCTYTYVPRPVSIENRVGDLHVTDYVRVSNVQSSSEPILLTKQMGDTFLADLHAWTETAVTVMQTELARRGMPSSSATDKELKLSVTRAAADFGFWTVGCGATLRVETTNGYTTELEGKARSSRTIFAAIDVCVARAVAEVLKDPTIIAYLQQSPPPAQ